MPSAGDGKVKSIGMGVYGLSLREVYDSGHNKSVPLNQRILYMGRQVLCDKPCLYGGLVIPLSDK